MQIETTDLISTSKAAKRLGVSRVAVAYWARRYKRFPKPVLKDPAIYLWSEISTWYANNNAYLFN